MIPLVPAQSLSRRAALGVAIAIFATTASAQGADPEAGYDALLKKYVSVDPDGINRVDYAAWRANTPDMAALNAYLADLTARRP